MLVGDRSARANYGMAGRAYSPRFMWTWPNLRASRLWRGAGSWGSATVKRDANWSAQARQLGPKKKRPRSSSPRLIMFEEQSHPRSQPRGFG